MENQHRKITGYRELTQDEIDCMNKIKALGEEIDQLYEHLVKPNTDVDMRWLLEGRTDLQKGIMCWVRAVAKPTTF
ncbi:hypothetical protein Xvie_03548 [Xenorhabdus vietnamensis]|uniref:Acb2/Tad1 hairpin domain-containing protein n=1 Tax=Xenorhabdus vietnamensis TaxID=351656 RepID=A0A1Y2SA69_9GAMM|nr:hypothetical protein [Xenorhabdus vietnamensis]OTA14611.1 hypothetical protein Xvie_03548 [Xenorhabdus vietnamensis]